MSSYEHYDFQTIDRQLTKVEQEEIGSWSSRSYPTASQATFTYHYGSFKKDFYQSVKNYFDAGLYVANWGTKHLVFKFPRGVITLKDLAPYEYGDAIRLERTYNHLLLEIEYSEEEGWGWLEAEGWLSEIISLRNDILNGDFRVLYLAWLGAATNHENYDFDGDVIEPPIPPNLGQLNKTLQRFVEMFGISMDIVDAASVGSPALHKQGSDAKVDYFSAIEQLSDASKIDFLLRLIKDEPHLSWKLKQHLTPKKSKTANFGIPSRTALDLIKLSDKTKALRKAEEERQARAAKLKAIQTLEKHVPQKWEAIYEMLNRKAGRNYKYVVEVLLELKEVAEYQKQLPQFMEKVAGLRTKYRRYSSFVTRLDKEVLFS